jgi:osmoprotectant transport system ATP-binding protein
MINIVNVSKTYNLKTVIKSLNLHIVSGNTTVLIGSSGSGKSTILKLIIGLVHPEDGDIFINKTKISDENIIPLRKKMGYVIQDGGLFPNLTAKDNIILMSKYLKKSKSWINDRLSYLIDLTNFPEDGLHRFPHNLSGGQQQRVSLMRALMLDPKVLLLDEPLSSLDPMIRSDLQIELKEIFSKLKKTVVFVTHDIGEAAYFGDHLVLLSDGSIVQQGSIHDFIKTPVNEFVSRFINAQSALIENIKNIQ